MTAAVKLTDPFWRQMLFQMAKEGHNPHVIFDVIPTPTGVEIRPVGTTKC